MRLNKIAVIVLLIMVISMPSFVTGVKAAAVKTIIVTENSKTMKVDGNDITLEVEPQRISDRLLLPLRAFAEDALDCTVSWDENTKTATIKNDEKIIIVTENSKIMTVDGNDILMDIEPQRVNDRLLLPLRAFAQHALGCTVIWDENTKTATITGPSIVSNTSPTETPKETEKPAELAVVIENPYSADQVAKLWGTTIHTLSQDDLSYILGYFIYECCIESNVDPLDIDFSGFSYKTFGYSYEVSLEMSGGKIKATLSNTKSSTMSGLSLDSLVERCVASLYTYLLNREEAAVKENMTNFFIQQDRLLLKTIKKGDVYPDGTYKENNNDNKEEREEIFPAVDYSDYIFDAIAGKLFAAKTMIDFLDRCGLSKDYREYYRRATGTIESIYSKHHEPESETFRFASWNYSSSIYFPKHEAYVYIKTDEAKRRVLENLTKTYLSEYPMLNYLYGIKDGKPYVKPLDEIKEYTASRLKECVTYEEAKDILTVYYNVPAIYGVNCPQRQEIQAIIIRISTGTIKGDKVKTSEELATVRPLTDEEVRKMFKELTGSEMRF